jgi:NADH-quinone oxidoreductase subunit D
MTENTSEATYTSAPNADDPYASAQETTTGRVYTVTGQDWDTVVAGIAESDEERVVVNMGPQHPSTHGVLRLILELEGETVTEARCGIGYLHTGIEKNMEFRTWTQGVTFCTRMDYLAPFYNEAAYCFGVERLLGIEDDIPEKARVMRVLLMELNRISSHLVAIATGGMEIGALTVMTIGFREREATLDLFELITGLRMNHAFFRPGGVAQDLPPGALDKIREYIKLMKKRLPEYAALCNENPIFKGRLQDVGHLDLAGCLALGATGPVLRATGYPWDLRKTQPYCGYETYDFDVATWDTMDAYGRFRIRLEEMHQSLRIVEQCADRLHGRRPQDRLAGAARGRQRRDGQLPRPHPAHHGRVHGGADPPLQAGDRGLPGAGRPGVRRGGVPARRAGLPRRVRRWHPSVPRALP